MLDLRCKQEKHQKKTKRSTVVIGADEIEGPAK